MLRIVEPEPLRHRIQSRPISRRSLVVSMIVHGLLAVLLWSFVFQTIRHVSITLSATPSASKESVSFQFGKPEQLVEAPWGEQVNDGEQDREVDVDSQFENITEDASLPEQEVESKFGPNSVEFFGARAYGNRFAFVLDVSYSMKARDGERYERACEELISAVRQLRPDQEYYVFLFSWYTQKMFFQRDVRFAKATGDHVTKLDEWLEHIVMGAGTDPRRALSLSLQLEPDAVFLLSDGHFNHPPSPNSETGWLDPDGSRSMESVLEGIEKRFERTAIHTISLENPFTVDSMRRIAKVTGGQFRYVRTSSLEPVNLTQLSSALRQIQSDYGRQSGSKAEFESRLAYARELIGSGELASAEYILRPVLLAEDSLVSNRKLLEQLSGILKAELKNVRIEDFEVSRSVLALASEP